MDADFGSVSTLVSSSIKRTEQFVETWTGREDEPAMRGYAEFGIPWYEAACQGESGLADIQRYRLNVFNASGAAWMDNTTIFTACKLMSNDGNEMMRPLTAWDLATFMRSTICYERIYHHEHPNIDDEAINRHLGSDVMVSIPLPLSRSPDLLPEKWNGAHRFMCDIWFDAHSWLKRLNESIGRGTLDGKQVEAVTAAWRAALGRKDLRASDVVDYVGVVRRWRSPSDQLLIYTANITDMLDTTVSLDPNAGMENVFKAQREAGLKDMSGELRMNVLSDLNLRSHVNQRLAEFFQLPYACSVARVPFRNFLYDRSLSIQQELATAKLVDDSYGELTSGVRLRLPVFLAVALRSADKPQDLWHALAALREDAAAFREHREEMDKSLARRDMKQLEDLSRALHASVDGLLTLAGNATTAAGGVLLDKVSKGDIEPVSTAISATVAVAKGLLKSSFADRIKWRLMQPELLWVNNLIDQAQHLTEAMPDFARIWKIPPNLQSTFAERFKDIGSHIG